MREAWGIAEDEPLPGPEKVGLEWHKGSRDPQNVKVRSGLAYFVLGIRISTCLQPFT